ncbi:protein NinG [Kluyvera intermedia]|uniref:Protein NinG n=1 Tax=Kluyvera intermedia TaxID=61648 RepID=A0ABX3U8M2_KLUIN|nr:recombination protein NinG [Kluyvera intermedia]ORJ47870.1 protein NinG [Kluyvera intermedia]
MKKKPRRKCKVCSAWFIPAYDNIRWCCPEHGAEYALHELEKKKERERKAKIKKERAEWRERKAAIKPLSHWINMTQRAYNDWRREYLLSLGYGCMSCGTKTAPVWHAGHYRTTATASQLRFNDNNVWLQCPSCNVHKSGNIEAYRAALVEEIGEDGVHKLECNNEAHRYTRKELDSIRAQSRAKLRDLKKQEAA